MLKNSALSLLLVGFFVTEVHATPVSETFTQNLDSNLSDSQVYNGQLDFSSWLADESIYRIEQISFAFSFLDDAQGDPSHFEYQTDTGWRYRGERSRRVYY